MSIYASFFALDGDDHDQECERHVPAKLTDQAVHIWWDGTHTTLDHSKPCTCGALPAPYKYLGSNRSITGPDHPTADEAVHMARAVGTWTLRLGIGQTTVLLDRRQVEATFVALGEFLEFWDDPEDYERSDAYDAAPADSAEKLAMREDRAERLDALLTKLIAERAGRVR